MSAIEVRRLAEAMHNLRNHGTPDAAHGRTPHPHHLAEGPAATLAAEYDRLGGDVLETGEQDLTEALCFLRHHSDHHPDAPDCQRSRDVARSLRAALAARAAYRENVP